MKNKLYDEKRLLNDLAGKIGEWIEAEAENGDFDFWIGDELAENMAIAALAVMRATADAQKYLEQNDLMKEG